jgi:hypothetical protein
MGPGHFGIAFAAKKIAPKAPLGALLVASETLDLLCFGFAAMGIEKFAVSETTFENGIRIIVPGYIPWSHGLLMSIVWSLAAASISWLVYRDVRTGGMIGLVVFSHWVLDFIVHLPDLPLLLKYSPVVGLGMWGTGPGLILSGLLEIGLLVTGIIMYCNRSKK